MSGYEAASLTSVESLKVPGALWWTPPRKHFGITAFGVGSTKRGSNSTARSSVISICRSGPARMWT